MLMLKILVSGIIIASSLYFLGLYIKGNMCHLENRIDGKIVLITGANTGIGLETAVELAKRGGIIHMACRDKNRCNNARDVILSRSNVDQNNVITHTLNLASIRSILSFTQQFKASVQKLDILINNAGIICSYLETEDGFEMQIGVNHLGHFLLTNELVDIIKKANAGRILIVSSNLHERGAINTTDINLRGDDYGHMDAYSQSKLANVLHPKYLAKSLKKDGISSVSLHPGVVQTEILRYLPGAYYLKKVKAVN